MAMSWILTKHCILISRKPRPNSNGHNAKRCSYLGSMIIPNLIHFKIQLICIFTYLFCVTFLYSLYSKFPLLQLKTMLCMKCIIQGLAEAWQPVHPTLRTTLKIHEHQLLLVIISAEILTTYAQFFPLNTGTICLKYFSKLKQQSFKNSKSVINFHQPKVLFLFTPSKICKYEFLLQLQKTINIMCNIHFEVFIIKL